MALTGGTARVANVVFDIGGVLLEWDPGLVYRELLPDPADLARFLGEVCTQDWNETLDAGRPYDEACDELAARHPDQADLIHAWKRQADMIAGEVPGTAAVVAQLREAGVPLFLLTNMPSHVFRERVERYSVLQGFDGAVVSGDEGLLKPSPEIFALLADRFLLDPAETLVIDDMERNVEGARAAGYQAHHFVGADDLVAALGAPGLPMA